MRQIDSSLEQNSVEDRVQWWTLLSGFILTWVSAAVGLYVRSRCAPKPTIKAAPTMELVPKGDERISVRMEN